MKCFITQRRLISRRQHLEERGKRGEHVVPAAAVHVGVGQPKRSTCKSRSDVIVEVEPARKCPTGRHAQRGDRAQPARAADVTVGVRQRALCEAEEPTTAVDKGSDIVSTCCQERVLSAGDAAAGVADVAGDVEDLVEREIDG